MTGTLQHPGTAVGGAILVCLIALGVIALLPRLFFRRGKLNPRWWLTAAPFLLAGGALGAGALGWLEPLTRDAEVRTLLARSAIGGAACALALIRWTVRSHALPVSLWHQENDRPHELVLRGPYAFVRHPFYASFLLTLAACALAFPHPLTLLALVGGLVQLDRTAAREEARLTAAFGHHYAAYIRRTGRFVPRGFVSAASGRRDALRPPIL